PPTGSSPPNQMRRRRAATAPRDARVCSAHARQRPGAILPPRTSRLSTTSYAGELSSTGALDVIPALCERLVDIASPERPRYFRLLSKVTHAKVPCQEMGSAQNRCDKAE